MEKKSVDTEAVKETVKEATEKTKKVAKETAETMKEAAENVMEKAETVRESAKKTARKAASTTKKVAADAKVVTEDVVENAKITTDHVKKTAKRNYTKLALKETYVQAGGREYKESEILEKVEAAYLAAGNKISHLKTLQLYIKPEDQAAYYVINSDITGKVDL